MVLRRATSTRTRGRGRGVDDMDSDEGEVSSDQNSKGEKSAGVYNEINEFSGSILPGVRVSPPPII
eukprot:3934475-Rhodomonas_salina.1